MRLENARYISRTLQLRYASLLPRIIAEIRSNVSRSERVKIALSQNTVQIASTIVLSSFLVIILSHRWTPQLRRGIKPVRIVAIIVANTHKIPQNDACTSSRVIRTHRSSHMERFRPSWSRAMAHHRDYTFHRCHLLRAIVRARERQQERLSTFDSARGSRDGQWSDAGSVSRARLSRSRMTMVANRGMHRRGCTWFREGEFRGHNKTTTSPAGRTAILLLLSVFLCSLPPPLSLSLFLLASLALSSLLFCAFTLSLSLFLEIPTDTERHRRTVNRYDLSSWYR